MIYEYLDSLEIPFNFESLLEEGFHEIEIKCALHATGKLKSFFRDFYSASCRVFFLNIILFCLGFVYHLLQKLFLLLGFMRPNLQYIREWLKKHASEGKNRISIISVVKLT